MIFKRDFRKSGERALEEAMFEGLIARNCLYPRRAIL